MTFKSRNELETEAWHRARETIDGNDEVAIIKDHESQAVVQLQRMVNFLAWAKKNLHYTEEKGTQAFKEAYDETLQTLFKMHFAHLIDIDDHAKEVEKISWKLFLENFVAVREDSDKELSLTDHVRESVETPTFLTILQEVRPWVADDLALKDWQQYIAKMAHALDGKIIDYDLGTDEDGKRKIVQFMLKYRPKD